MSYSDVILHEHVLLKVQKKKKKSFKNTNHLKTVYVFGCLSCLTICDHNIILQSTRIQKVIGAFEKFRTQFKLINIHMSIRCEL